MNRILSYIASVAAVISLTMCAPKSAPTQATPIDAFPNISPDYAGVVVPPNIAPLNFMILDTADQYVTTFTAPQGKPLSAAGRKLDIKVAAWHRLLEQARGSDITVQVFAKRDGQWFAYQPFAISVANEEIDPYISYRQIEPSYTSFEEMAICQRHLEDFDQEDIFNNSNLSLEDNGQCINCHNYQDYNRGGNMQFHARVNKGGTIIVKDGVPTKVNLRTGLIDLPAVYPAWHPTLPLIAYSCNNTTQSFHSLDPNRIEVQDSESALALYDTEANSMSLIADAPDQLETFPAWSPDGKTLYYASAYVPQMSAYDMTVYQTFNYKDFKYDIMRMAFDPATRTFSKPDTVFCASEIGKSATLPRISPDGRYLLFTMGEFGTFHIWHRDADLYLLDLEQGNVEPLEAVNSDNVDSYHSWSSNGRWILFSSRRGDGDFTRLYISYFDADGNAHKPFLLPQRDPEHDLNLYKSYNVPEFMAQPVNVSKRALISAVSSEAKQASF